MTKPESLRHTTVLSFQLDDAATADAIARALGPEASQAEVPKTRGTVHVVRHGDAGAGGHDGLRAEGATLAIELEAEDLPSLRATVNSHLRWVDAAVKASRIARD